VSVSWQILGCQSEGLGINRFDHTNMGLLAVVFQNMRLLVWINVGLFVAGYGELLSER
jgi:hypothetical protein